MIWLAITGLMGAFILAGWSFSKQEAEGDKVGLRERLASLTKNPDAAQKEIQTGKNAVKTTSPKDDLKKLISSMTGEAVMMRWEKALAQADIPIRVSEFLMLRVLVIAGGAALTLSLVHNAFVAAGVGAVLFVIHGPIFALKRAMRINKFVVQLSEFLMLICNSLRSGQTFIQGVDMASKESPAPISVEFRHLLRETNLGMPIDESFNNMYLRVPSDDLKIVLSAFSIQRQVGGNLADILEQVSKTIRERIKIQGQIKVLTTQGKMSGLIVGLMPFGLGIILTMVSPDYMSQLWDPKGFGPYLIGVGVFLQLLGCFVIYQICDIDV